MSGGCYAVMADMLGRAHTRRGDLEAHVRHAIQRPPLADFSYPSWTGGAGQ